MSQKIWIHILLLKGYIFPFLKSSGIKQIFWLPGVWYPRESVFSNLLKNQITQQKLNKNRKYFDPLVSGPGWFKWCKSWRLKISLDCTFNISKKRWTNFFKTNSYFILSVHHNISVIKNNNQLHSKAVQNSKNVCEKTLVSNKIMFPDGQSLTW